MIIIKKFPVIIGFLLVLTLLFSFGCGESPTGGTGEVGDTTAPTVTLASPASNATKISVSTNIEITFSETIMQSTLTTSNGFSLISSGGSSIALSNITFVGNKATITLASNLEYSTTYTATAANSIKDSAGNRMTNHYAWSFTTTDVDTPAGLTSSATLGAISLSWDEVTNADSYNIYWSTSTGVTKSNGTKISGVSTNSYVFTNITYGNTYYFIITAIKGAIESSESNEKSAIPENTGTLDSAFGSSGIVKWGGAGVDIEDFGISIFLTSNNEIYIGGETGGDFCIWNYTTSGNLDTTFDSDGYKVITDTKCQEIAINSANQIFVAGFSLGTSGQDMFVWKLNTDGSLDTGFNDPNGYNSHNNAAGGDSHDYGYGIVLDNNGKINISGMSYSAVNNYDMTLWRYNADGTIDTTFNPAFGYTTEDGEANDSDVGRTISITPDNKIIVGGSTTTSNAQDATLWKYTSGGILDTSFGNNGIVTHNNAAGGNGEDSIRAITIEANGKIIACGISSNGSNLDMVIWKFNANGSLDTSFNSTGYVVQNNIAGGNGDERAYAIALTKTNKIIVSGFSAGTNYNDLVIWRYNSDGTLDTTFANNGVFVKDSVAGGSNRDEGRGIAIDSQGKMYITGYSYGSSADYDMFILRLE